MSDAVQQLLEILRDGPTHGDMYGAMLALQDRGSEAVQGLILVVRDGRQPEAFRARAADTLGRMGAAAAEGALIDVAQDPSVFVRWSVISALGKLGSRAAVPVLRRCLEDQGRQRISRHFTITVREAAREALRRIMGQADSAF